MKLFTAVLQFLVAARVVVAYSAINIADIPTCAIPCLVGTLTQTSCDITDFECMCGHSAFVTQDVMPCLLANCTMAESLELAKIQATMCDKPAESRQNLLYATTIIGISIQIVFVTLRLMTRLMVQKKLGLDDWLIIAGMGVVIFDGVIIFQTVRHGLGIHMWQLGAEDVPAILTGFIISEASYPIILCLIRISLLVFYLRIFPSRGFQRMVKCFIVSGIIHTIIYFFLIVFQCSPVQFAWEKDTPTPGTCLNMNSLAYSGAVVALIYDFCNLLMPINELRKLQMNTAKKIGIIIMFSLGSCGCIASLIRLRSIASFSSDLNSDPDTTWTNVDILFWTIVEVTSSMVLSCCPYIKILICHLAPKDPRQASSAAGSFFPRSRHRGYSETGSVEEGHRNRSHPNSIVLPERDGQEDFQKSHPGNSSQRDLRLEVGEIKLAEPKPVVVKIIAENPDQAAQEKAE